MASIPPDADSAPARDRRALSLDALRGLAILMMCLSGILPGELPNWMYHGYYPTSLPTALNAEPSRIAIENDRLGGPWEPVPQKRFRADWPSLTWVDVVFPMFLFAMGAAIPLALGARRRHGDSRWKLARGACVRFALLVGFAVYVKQVTPSFMEDPPGVFTWILALLAIIPPGLVLTRLPGSWRLPVTFTLRGAGWASAIALVAWVHTRSERPFSWRDHDIILLLLAWSSLLVTLVSILASRWVALRLLLVLPIAFLAHHQAMRPGWRLLGDRFDDWMPWLQSPMVWLDRSAWSGPLPPQWFDFSPLYNFTWFKFAGIVVLGSLVGDVLWKRQTTPSETQPCDRYRLLPDLALTGLLLTAVAGCLVGLKDYATVYATPMGWTIASPYTVILLGGLPAGLALLVAWRGAGQVDGGLYLKTLTQWGAAFLAVGIILAVLTGPALDTAFGFFEGGIKKGPPATLSWYLVSLGISVLILTALALWLDVRRAAWPFGWLIANGQNPMLAYLGIRNLLAPLVALPVLWWSADGTARSLNGWVLSRMFDGGPWETAIWSGLQTLGLAFAVWALTRRGIVWRT